MRTNDIFTATYSPGSDPLRPYKTLKAIPKPYRSLAPVIEGVRRELANGLRERTKKKGRS